MTMDRIKERTIGEIVAEDYRTAGVFKQFGLDFCCGGGRTVEDACTSKGVEIESLIGELSALEKGGDESHNYQSWSPDFLADYIVNNHHEFCRSKLPEIGAYAKKVAQVHGKGNEALIEIFHEFTMMHADIMNHLDKEERILFPYIKQLVEAEKQGTTPPEPDFGKAANPIAMMEEEHDEAGEAMTKIRKLSNDFRPPEEACTTYRILFENLEAFEKDLHKHIHLENNILFPKALELEEHLN